MNQPNWANRTMWTGDNLDIMRGINSDLIYLDPPFNSNRNYAAPIGSEAAGAAFNSLTQSQKEHLITGYILLFEYVADYCDLSYGNTVQLLDYYACELAAVRFTSQDGTKPRAFLMGFM